MDVKKIIFVILAIIAVICVIFTIFTVATNNNGNNETVIENSTNSSSNSTVHADSNIDDHNLDDYHFTSQDSHQSSSSGSGKDDVHETTVTNDKGEQETVKWSESEGLL